MQTMKKNYNLCVLCILGYWLYFNRRNPQFFLSTCDGSDSDLINFLELCQAFPFQYQCPSNKFVMIFSWIIFCWKTSFPLRIRFAMMSFVLWISLATSNIIFISRSRTADCYVKYFSCLVRIFEYCISFETVQLIVC